MTIHSLRSAIAGCLLVSLSGLALASPSTPPALNLADAESLQLSIQAMESSLPAGSVHEEAFRQALVFAIFDYELSQAAQTLENGGEVTGLSREAHGMSVTDLYANAVPYWEQELAILQQAAMMGELKPGVTMAEAQAHIAKLQAMISLGSR